MRFVITKNPLGWRYTIVTYSWLGNEYSFTPGWHQLRDEIANHNVRWLDYEMRAMDFFFKRHRTCLAHLMRSFQNHDGAGNRSYWIDDGDILCHQCGLRAIREKLAETPGARDLTVEGLPDQIFTDGDTGRYGEVSCDACNRVIAEAICSESGYPIAHWDTYPYDTLPVFQNENDGSMMRGEEMVRQVKAGHADKVGKLRYRIGGSLWEATLRAPSNTQTTR